MQDAYSFVEEIVSKQKVYEYSYKRNEVIEKALDQPRGQLDCSRLGSEPCRRSCIARMHPLCKCTSLAGCSQLPHPATM